MRWRIGNCAAFTSRSRRFFRNMRPIPAMRQRFEREVLSAREVVHPNLCPIYDLGHWKRPEGQLTYLTMKLLAGESLAARLSREGPLPGEEALSIFRQVGAGIAAAHDAGILHRDIKTPNIILQGSGGQVLAWVTDFGLARAALGKETALTLHGVAGTPGFMAPELFYGSAPTKASDVYALGVVAHLVLTGRAPQVPMRRGKSVGCSFSVAEIPEPWRRFVEGCLKPAVEDRFQTSPKRCRRCPRRPCALKLRSSSRAAHLAQEDGGAGDGRRPGVAARGVAGVGTNYECIGPAPLHEVRCSDAAACGSSSGAAVHGAGFDRPAAFARRGVCEESDDHHSPETGRGPGKRSIHRRRPRAHWARIWCW